LLEVSAAFETAAKGTELAKDIVDISNDQEGSMSDLLIDLGFDIIGDIGDKYIENNATDELTKVSSSELLSDDLEEVCCTKSPDFVSLSNQVLLWQLIPMEYIASIIMQVAST